MLKVFYCYSHSDENYRNELEKNLSILKKKEIIDEWHDRKIIASEEWDHIINVNMQNSHIILLLISSDFIVSDYCYDIEMQNAMELHNNGKAAVVPIILRPCVWKDTPFAKLQALPKDGLPVSKWPDRDDAWLSVAEGIKKLCENYKTIIHPPVVENKVVIENHIIVTQYILQLDEEINLSNSEIYDFGKSNADCSSSQGKLGFKSKN